MGEVVIKIRIGDRDYPLRVKAEEEGIVRSAAKKVTDMMKAYRDQFGLDDKQDLLAMVSFDCLVEKMRSEEQRSINEDELCGKISNLRSQITNLLLSLMVCL